MKPPKQHRGKLTLIEKAIGIGILLLIVGGYVAIKLAYIELTDTKKAQHQQKENLNESQTP